MASRLLARGFEVAAYDPRRAQVAALAASGLRAACSVETAVAGAEVVFTILPTPAVVETVWLDPGGLLDTASKGTVLLQMSTISPGLAARLGEEARSRTLPLEYLAGMRS